MAPYDIVIRVYGRYVSISRMARLCRYLVIEPVNRTERRGYADIWGLTNGNTVDYNEGRDSDTDTPSKPPRRPDGTLLDPSTLSGPGSESIGDVLAGQVSPD